MAVLNQKRIVGIVKGVIFYYYPNDREIWAFAPYGLKYPQNYTIDQLHNMWMKRKKGEN